MDTDRDNPLKDEAARRAEWRGDDSEAPSPEADGHTLPASEDNDEAMKAGGGAPQVEISPPD